MPKMPHTATSLVGIRILIHRILTLVLMISYLSKWWVSRSLLPREKKKDGARAWLLSRVKYSRVSSRKTTIGALSRSKLLLKRYNLGVSKSTNGAGTERRRNKMPNLWSIKQQTMKIKKAINDNTKLLKALSNDFIRIRKWFKFMIDRFTALFNIP